MKLAAILACACVAIAPFALGTSKASANDYVASNVINSIDPDLTIQDIIDGRSSHFKNVAFHQAKRKFKDNSRNIPSDQPIDCFGKLNKLPIAS
jgi:hypothetical protein